MYSLDGLGVITLMAQTINYDRASIGQSVTLDTSATLQKLALLLPPSTIRTSTARIDITWAATKIVPEAKDESPSTMLSPALSAHVARLWGLFLYAPRHGRQVTLDQPDRRCSRPIEAPTRSGRLFVASDVGDAKLSSCFCVGIEGAADG